MRKLSSFFKKFNIIESLEKNLDDEEEDAKSSQVNKRDWDFSDSDDSSEELQIGIN